MIGTAAWVWWAAVGLLVMAELTTGTFYLLMLAAGALGGALAAHAGLGWGAQCAVAAALGGAMVGVLAWRRHVGTPRPSAASDPTVQQDVGGQVRVVQWDDTGRATVPYRGAAWQARAEAGTPPRPGAHTIVAIEGNVLILRPNQP